MTKRILAIGNFYSSHDRHVLHGAATYARLHGWHITPQYLEQGSRTVQPNRYDGILIGSLDKRFDRMIARSALPVAGWSTMREKTPWPRVMSDNAAIGRLIAQTFLSSGYRNFAYFPDAPGLWSRQRKTAFFSSVEAAGHTVYAGADLADRGGVPRLASWLKRLPRPLALMLSYDVPAQMVVAACDRASLRIPEDVAIISVGNDEMVCEIINPPISSVSQLTERIGYQTAEILDRLMQGARKVPEFILVPPGQLITRRSSDSTAFDDPLVTDALRLIRAKQPGLTGVKQVLTQIGVSRMTLDKRFVAATGSTVAVAIREMRIEKAKQLLSTSDLQISRIAAITGFSSGRHFSKAFHRFTGKTPTVFRRKEATRGLR